MHECRIWYSPGDCLHYLHILQTCLVTSLATCCICSALDRTRSRVVSYEDQVTALREQLSDIFALEEEWSKAAQLLAEVDLDSGKECV